LTSFFASTISRLLVRSTRFRRFLDNFGFREYFRNHADASALLRFNCDCNLIERNVLYNWSNVTTIQLQFDPFNGVRIQSGPLRLF